MSRCTWLLPTALGGLLALAQPALADEYDPLRGDAAEQELLQSLRGEKLIRAREQAEQLLRTRPDSFLATYALSVVFHDEEANLPRALYFASRAEQLLTARYGARPQEREAEAWHRRLLEEQSDILGEMDRRQEQLQLLDRHDALYEPPLDRRRIWPLMKLGRFAEARRLARKEARSSELPVRISGLNGLLAIECERLRMQSCFKTGLEAIASTGGQSCILLENTAEAAFAVFRFAEAERLALQALQAKIKDCPASSHPHLANLYLARGDFQRAMAAVKSAREYGIERRYRQQFEMGITSWLARLLYTLGQFSEARQLTDRVSRLPDRVGMTSFSQELMRLVATVDHHAALLAEQEALREEASVRPLRQRASRWAALAAKEAELWASKRRALQLLLAREQTLVQLVRPYFKPLPPWQAGALIAIAGRGVLLRAIEQARQQEALPAKAAPYFDSLAGEIAYRAGDLEQALTLGQRAVAGLPQDELLLRERTRAYAADAARRLGRAEQAEALFHEVLRRFPTALRLLQVRLPATIRADGQALSQEVAEALLDSRRLARGGQGFSVQITSQGARVRICLLGSGGARYACAEKDVSSAPPEQRAAWASDAFHRKVFAPKVDLTQRDINSLDGSAVRGDADQLLQEMLDQ